MTTIRSCVIEVPGMVEVLEVGSVRKLKPMFDPIVDCQTFVVVTEIRVENNRIIVETLNSANLPTGEIIRDVDFFELEELLLSTTKIR